jgi:tripartite-type tricarboxylate transporter receptor subunit TctC
MNVPAVETPERPCARLLHRVLRRRAAFGGALALIGAALRPAEAEAEFPTQPIRLIVPFAPGTGSDVVARLITEEASAALGRPLVVENRSGAGGATGTDQGARASADGHTLILGTTSTLIVNPLVNPRIQYRFERDFVPVAGLAQTSFALVTANTPGAPGSFRELIQQLGAQDASYGSPGVGTIAQLVSELVLRRAGVAAAHVPYRGSSQALGDVISGQVLFASDTLAATLPLVQGGTLRALAVTSAERLPMLPDVPTVAESGFPGLVVNAWFGLVAPAATPQDRVGRLSRAILDALSAPALRNRFQTLELEVLPLAPAPFAAFIRTDAAFWADFIRQANIRIEF